MFAVFRVVFLGYHYDELARVSLDLVPGIFIHGLHLDLSAAAWLSIIPFLMAYLSSLFPFRVFKLFYRGMMFFMIFLLTIVTIADLEVFNAWGTRMDATIIRYLGTPSEAYAASSAAPVGSLLLSFIILSVILFKAHTKVIGKPVSIFKSLNRWDFLILPACLAFLLIAGRGGLQQIPINISFAYFSNNDFANQAAINQNQQFFYSIWLKYTKMEKPYNFMPHNEAEQMVKALYKGKDEESFQKIVKSNRPNIILILWESLTANALGLKEGEKKVLPEFENLISQGIHFSRIYSSGTRTSKGLPAIISGYPAQPGSPVIMNSRKVKSLPSIGRSLKQEGYSTSFYYGGDLEFDNMKVFLTRANMDKLVGRSDFPADLTKSKWGAHDHNVFEKVAADLKKENKPFFCCILTLSSHEPFEVPAPTRFTGKDHESMFKNSLNYADRSISDFIKSIKTESWYENTLIIITADHGTSLIGDFARFRPEKFHTPLLFIGGALASQGLVIDKIGSQQDLAATLLAQLNLSTKEFKFSRNLLSFADNPSFAASVFSNGISFITDKGFLAFDNSARSMIHKDPQLSMEDEQTAKAFMQFTFQDYLDR